MIGFQIMSKFVFCCFVFIEADRFPNVVYYSKLVEFLQRAISIVFRDLSER